MSRKDPRAALSVPLTGDELRWLRARARGRSLGNALRRAVEDTLADPGPVDPAPDGARRLPLQLPRHALARIDAIHRATGQAPADIVRAALARAMSLQDHAEDGAE